MASVKRITQLDGLRGVAALMVAASHSYYIFLIDGVNGIWYKTIFDVSAVVSAFLTRLILIVANGEVAVTLFFLISGFLMGNSLERHESSVRSVGKFYIRRFLRLYPVFLFTILATALFLIGGYHYQHYAFATDWFNNWFSGGLSLREVASNLVFRSVSLSGVTWTMKVEAWTILAFPILFILYSKNNRWVNVVAALSLAVIGIRFPGSGVLPYVYIFYLGLLYPQWKGIFTKLSISVVLAVALLVGAHDLFTQPGRQFIESVAAWVLLGYVIYREDTSIFRILNRPIVLFFGSISYPFFLLHFPVLYLLSLAFIRWVPVVLLTQYSLAFHSSLFILTVVCTAMITLIFHKYIELPFIRFGKKFGL